MGVHSWTGRCFTLEPFELRLDHSGHSMFVHVNVRRAHAQRAGDFLDRPLLERVEVEHLELLWLDLGLNPRERDVPEVPLPLCVPDCFEVQTLWIGDALDRGG